MLPEKVIIKANRELLDLHKRCITTYLTQRSVKYRTQKKFFKIYDKYINENNIRNFFFSPIKIFVYALVMDRLEKISNYVVVNIGNKKRKKKK